MYPTYTAMIGNLRSEGFENFKSSLEHSLNEGEGFAASVRGCTHSCMLEFDCGCAGLYFESASHVLGISGVFILSVSSNFCSKYFLYDHLQ